MSACLRTFRHSCILLSFLCNSLWFPAKECSTERAREKWNDRSQLMDPGGGFQKYNSFYSPAPFEDSFLPGLIF